MTTSKIKSSPDVRPIVAAAMTVLTRHGAPKRSRRWKSIFMDKYLWVEAVYRAHPHKAKDRQGNTNGPSSILIHPSPVHAIKHKRQWRTLLYAEISADGGIDVLSFRRGRWQNSLLRLAAAGGSK